jgi:hypothetical protein
MLHRVAAAFVVCLPLSCFLLAQSPNATITGRITDPSKAAVTGAKVIATNVDTGIQQELLRRAFKDRRRCHGDASKFRRNVASAPSKIACALRIESACALIFGFYNLLAFGENSGRLRRVRLAHLPASARCTALNALCMHTQLLSLLAHNFDRITIHQEEVGWGCPKLSDLRCCLCACWSWPKMPRRRAIIRLFLLAVQERSRGWSNGRVHYLAYPPLLSTKTQRFAIQNPIRPVTWSG